MGNLPGEHSHFLATLKEFLNSEAQPLALPVHDRRGLTDVAEVVKHLPAALKLEGGCWNFGGENDGSTYATVKSVLETLGREEALSRLMPNEEAFARNPRDIRMDLSRLHSAGIFFPTTKEGLCMALEETV